jgi:TonB family protein
VDFGAEETLVVYRRRKRSRPMRSFRLGVHLHAQPSAAGAAAALDFPGISIPEPEDARRRWWTSLLSLLIHASIFGGLLLWALFGPHEIEERLIEVKILNEPQAEKTDPAPARRVLAERRSTVFKPQAQAVRPQVVNPRVVARAVPQVAAERIDMNNVNPVAAPRQVSRAAVSVEKVSAVRSVGPAATTQRVDLQAAAGPALRGPREIEAPAGPSVGPRQVTRVGDTIGVGTVERQGDGSSVREGIASNRDVLGSAAGPRLANVNTNVGEGLLEGSGGTGQGGVSFADCFERPEVKEYWTAIERRMYARWVLPADVSSNQEVRLRFQLDAAGSARTVEIIPGGDQRLGKSAMDALRSAAPFPPMSDRVRCLAGAPIVGTFRNPLASGVH